MSIASQAFQSAKIFPRSESFTLGIVGLGLKLKKRQDRRRVEKPGFGIRWPPNWELDATNIFKWHRSLLLWQKSYFIQNGRSERAQENRGSPEEEEGCERASLVRTEGWEGQELGHSGTLANGSWNL